MTRASHDQIRSRLRKARRDEAKLVQKPKRYRNKLYKCVGCDPSKPKQICQGDSSGIKDKIVGMGVSAIIAVAARRAFERWVDA